MVPHATGTTVSADLLAPETAYILELETYRGALGTPATTRDGSQIGVIAIFESINTIHVPEPPARLLQLSAVSVLALIARRRGARQSI